MEVREILEKEALEREDLIALLDSEGKDKQLLFKKALEVKLKEVGNKVFFRGLVEFSNICGKDCYYCGIRKSNTQTHRYNVSDEQILDAARFAHANNYGSFVMQAGELESPAFHLEYGLVPHNQLCFALCITIQFQRCAPADGPDIFQGKRAGGVRDFRFQLQSGYSRRGFYPGS